MHYAAVEGHLPVVEFLISRHIDVSVRDNDGTSAAFRAHGAGYDDIVCLLGSVFGDTDDLLYIHEEDGDNWIAQTPLNEPLYAAVNKSGIIKLSLAFVED